MTGTRRRPGWIRILRSGALVVAAVLISRSAFADWPSVWAQLQESQVRPGTALERLILDNQQFEMLHPDEASDKLPYPPWLRVYWRKAHPDRNYSAIDPTRGYPRVLTKIHAWMMTHQELVAGPAAPLVEGVASAEQRARLSVGGNLRISGAQSVPRSESDIRINFWNGTKVVAASNNVGGNEFQAQYFSTDAGAHWGQTTLPAFGTDAFHSDPSVDWTSDGTAWSTTLGINSSGTVTRGRAYKSFNGGATWTFDGTFSGAQTDIDKPMMWVDHSAASPFANNIYVIWNQGPAYVNRRTSAGWQTPVQVSRFETIGTAVGGDVKTNAFGEVFAFWPDTVSNTLYVAKSTDGGASYGSPNPVAATFGSFTLAVPAINDRQALIYVSGAAYRTATRNEVYASWVDLTGAGSCTAGHEPGADVTSPCKSRVWFARSTDGGATWSTPSMINDQLSLNDQFNQWLALDETTGALGIIYYDTIADPGRLKTDVWYQRSTDGGATWSWAVKVTTAQTDETVAGADFGNQYGDYNGLSANAGILFPSWTDRRNGINEEIWTVKLDETPVAGTLPDAPTIGNATAGNASISVDFTPGALGTGALVNFTANCGGVTAVGTIAPITVTGLINGNVYTCVVRTTTAVGTSASSAASNPATPFIADDNFPPEGSIPAGWFQPAGSSAPWAVAADAAYAGSLSLKSGLIGNNQSSQIAVTGNFAAGNVSFARMVSSEQDFDFLEFYIDGVLQQRWSGILAWSVVSFPMSAGMHTVRWRYAKDNTVAAGGDAGWIDSVLLPAIVPITSPSLVAVFARKVHGVAGTFNLPLSGAANNPTIEPRQGTSHTIVFTFDKPVTAGVATVIEGVATAGVPTFSGSEMRVPLTGVANQQYVTVTVSNVNSADGGTGGSGSIRVGFLLGDVNQNRVVTLSDLGQVNAQVAQPVNSANFLRDVNASGTLSVADKGIVNMQITKALPAP